eukprot:PhM_4_TR388/c5_g1_i2/m.106705
MPYFLPPPLSAVVITSTTASTTASSAATTTRHHLPPLGGVDDAQTQKLPFSLCQQNKPEPIMCMCLSAPSPNSNSNSLTNVDLLNFSSSSSSLTLNSSHHNPSLPLPRPPSPGTVLMSSIAKDDIPSQLGAALLRAVDTVSLNNNNNNMIFPDPAIRRAFYSASSETNSPSANNNNININMNVNSFSPQQRSPPRLVAHLHHHQSGMAAIHNVDALVRRLAMHAQCSDECYAVAAVLLDRWCAATGVQLHRSIVHKLTLTALVVALKMYDDQQYPMDWYAQVGGVETPELINAERVFLGHIKW